MGWRVLLDAALVRSLLPPPAREAPVTPAPLVPLQRAAAALALPLQVHLEGCEVDIGSLQDLRPGDVVRLQVRVGEAAMSIGELLAARENEVLLLDRAVEQPVDLMLEGSVVARGRLVAVDGSFAVQITELPLPLEL
jgi:flagellar motor switch protein FliN